MELQPDFLVDDLNESELKHEWLALEAESAGSFFLSWSWISSWIAACPKEAKIKQLKISLGGKIVGIGLFSESTNVRHCVFRSKILALNEYIQSNLDMMIEHNGLLVERTLSPNQQKALLIHLNKRLAGWDEIRLSGISDSSPLLDEVLHQRLKLNCRVVAESEARRVNLERIRKQGGGFLKHLSKKTRYKVRKYLREYNELGTFQVSEARDLNTALLYFAELKLFHQRYWNAKGENGSFGSLEWENFHINVIKKSLNEGSLQLIRVSVGGYIIGYVYSLVKSKHIYMIQSGYNYDECRGYHPGYVCLYLVVDYNLKIGSQIFDFLAGDNQYKKSFSNESVKLVWVILQKKKKRFWIENLIRQARRKLIGLSDNVNF